MKTNEPPAHIRLGRGTGGITMPSFRVSVKSQVGDRLPPAWHWLYFHDLVKRVRHIPGFIVQGRYDVVCPMTSAWDLHRRWPEARFEIVPDAGHTATEPGTIDRLLVVTEQIRDSLVTTPNE